MKPLRLLLLLLIALPTATFAQSPWVQAKGHAYSQVGFSQIPDYTGFYDQNAGGTRSLDRAITDQTFQAYTEYGIADGWSAWVNLPVKMVSAGEPRTALVQPSFGAGDLMGLGNIDVAARYQLLNKKFVSAAQLRVGAPTYNHDPLTGLSTGFPAFTFEPMLSIGQGGKSGYWFAYGGAGFRTANYSHFGRLGVEGGLDFKDRIWFVLFADANLSFRDGNAVSPPGGYETGLYLNDQEYVAYGLKFIVEAIKGRLGFYGSMAGASNPHHVAQQFSSSLGVYYKWSVKE